MELIKCEICGEQVHAIQTHLKNKHPNISLASYQATYPNAPLLSEQAKKAIEEFQRKQNPSQNQEKTLIQAAMSTPTVVNNPSIVSSVKKPMAETFGLPAGKGLNGRGEPIMVTVLTPSEEFKQYVPEVDPGHVWNEEDLKNMLMAFEMNIPLYAYGHKGTGKTTDIEQICARTGRPLMRVQHTINTEESHILGQRIIKDGHTPFEYGPLPTAMMNGLVFLADEYDFALASVLSVYQPVLEGKSLYIKEADANGRVIRPDPVNFRFVATGNTNGSGDDTGLYAGTSIQNSANYDRFAMVIEKKYMDPEAEAVIVRNRSAVSEKEARKLVEFAGDIRKQFEAGKLSDTISTRALVNISKIGLRRSSMRLGIQLCFANKLNKVDRAVVDGVAQRIYGSV